MLRDYLIFFKKHNNIKSIMIEDIKYFEHEWHHNGPRTLTFHRVDNKRKHTFEVNDILKLLSLQYIGDEVNIKVFNLVGEINEKLKCYFAHSWRSKDHPDKKRIVAALERMKIEVIDPFNNEDDLCVEYGEKEYYPNCNYKLGRAMWIKDLEQIRKCDMFLLWSTSDQPQSAGKFYELAYAFDHGKHIQIISDLRHPCMAYVLCHGNRQYNTIEDFENARRIRWR